MAKKKKWIKKAVPKSHRGRFTKKAKAHGMSVQQYAKKVLSKKSKASTKTKRQAALARRFSKKGDIGKKRKGKR